MSEPIKVQTEACSEPDKRLLATCDAINVFMAAVDKHVAAVHAETDATRATVLAQSERANAEGSLAQNLDAIGKAIVYKGRCFYGIGCGQVRFVEVHPDTIYTHEEVMAAAVAEDGRR